jgi:hypothetical protein
MSYDTEHVRKVGDGSGTITGLPTFTELFTNANLAHLYTAVRHTDAVTAPELVELVDISLHREKRRTRTWMLVRLPSPPPMGPTRGS